MITGTMIAPIMGLSRWTTIQDLWLQAKGLKEIEETEEMMVGKLLEPVLLNWYEQEFKTKLKRAELIVWSKNPNFGGHPDAIDEANKRIVEIKTTRKLNGCAVEWNCQVQWYLLLTDLQEAYIYAVEVPPLSLDQFRTLLEDGYDLKKLTKRKIYLVKRDDEFLKNAIDYAERFLKLLELDEPPKEWNLPASLIYPSGSGIIEANENILEDIRQIKELNEQISNLENMKKNLIEKVKEFMREKEILTFKGKILATWKNSEKISIDSKSLKENFPDIYSIVQKKLNSRIFLVK